MSLFGKLGAIFRRLIPPPAISPDRRRAVKGVERVQRIVGAIEATAESEIDCEEVYRLLDEYADLLVRGEDPARMYPRLEHHLKMCLDCQEELEALLDALRVTTG
jgi:hypothetical protein